VKNNLQLIISMLNLQKPSIDSEKIDSEKSKKTEVLVNIENRINSMALIHDQLYNTTSLNRINMPDYFEKLVGSIRESFDLEQRTISIEVSSVDLDLPIDKALPLGIIVNELISNSIKHAFHEVDHGEIKVLLYRVDQSHRYCLKVEDNGGGCSPECLESEGGLGLTLVRQLAMQIGGTANFDTAGGFTGSIEFQTGEL
jgi:two-component sensor histidine kinase